MLNPTALTNTQTIGSEAKTALNNIAQNTINVGPTLTLSQRTDAGVRILTLTWTAHVANIGGLYYHVVAGSLDLNAADVALPTTYYIYETLAAGVVSVVSATTDPDTLAAFDFAWLLQVRFQSVAGTITLFYRRRAYCANEEILHNAGAWDMYTPATWLTGGAVTVDAVTGAVDVEELQYTRLRFSGTIAAIADGVMLLSDETTTYADLEDATTYIDGSAITAGKYHKLLLGVILCSQAAYPLVLVRQGVPDTEYATLDEAIIDAERVAAVGFPQAYRGVIFPLCYVAMKLSDAADLEVIDLRTTGIIGGGGGGGGIADHGLLAGLGDDDHLQYFRGDGTRVMTADIDLDGNALANYTPQAANTFYAGPISGVDAAPAFRALIPEDMAAGPLLPFAMASDSTTQAIANVANAQVITFNTSELLSSTGITRTSTSRYTINTAGTYLITFSGIASLAALPGDKYLEMWLRVDGVDVPRSNTRVQLETAGTVMTLAVSFLYKFTAGQYIEFWTWGDDTDCRWLATAAAAGPVRPAVPSIIMTINMVSGAWLA